MATDQEVIGGMYSIFLDVTREVWSSQHVSTPMPGRAVNLVEAIDTVRCDGNAARRRGRQRYVVTKLAAGTVLMRRAHEDGTAQRYAKALEALDVDRILLERLDGSPAKDLVHLEGEAGRIIDAEPLLCDFQRSCCSCITDCTAGASGGTAAVQFSLRVPRDPKDVSCVIDPQTWPTVVPGYFKSVYVMDTPPCSGTDPQCRTNGGPCPPGQPPVAAPKPPKPGSTWCGLVDEQFETQAVNTTTKLESVLRVRMAFSPDDPSTPGDETATRMTYGLCEAVSYDVGGKPQPCGLELDCGEASVKASGLKGESRFSGIKSVRFQKDLPEDPNGWAPIALEVLVDESALASCLVTCDGRESPASVDDCPTAATKCECPSTDACLQSTLPFTPPPTDFCP